MISRARLLELVHYEPETGVFTARVARPPISVGQVLGCVNGKGYVDIMLEARSYRASRLAWLYMTGEWPRKLVDHRDRDRANNAWLNLREATNAENSRNAKLSKRNASGVKGVYWYARHQKWNAQIRVDRKLMSLGYYEDIEPAALARRAAEAKYFGEFAAQ